MSCESVLPQKLIVTLFRGPNGTMKLATGAVRDGKVYVEGDIVVGTEEEVQFARAFWGLQTGATLEGVPESIIDAAVHFVPEVSRTKAALHLRMSGNIDRGTQSSFRKELDLVEAYLQGDRSCQAVRRHRSRERLPLVSTIPFRTLSIQV
jgi:hypothetical protein